ncbi:acetolactate synthase [Asanoa ishikariensis]|uniref:Acetolactate synthase, large subunit n=1 Tax=Asanoa ishikariensis TaxID=137265 RepID=A0A1H3UP37_9ACTN|nr:acetolactate synthase AlsS [Asanoa ishikariensis]GIF69030.1 acetolactate synthase [Asanoa ishikariensis]SDZ63811.1 acetolactate synthase, large subunit [Asanoa ishikariensis]
MTQPHARPVRTADRLVEGLAAQGVPYIFGVPGAKIDQTYDALNDGGPELVVCRHEQNAAFMAGAVGRLTGTPGVVLVTSGPGTTNLATGLVTANTEGDPVLALCGEVPLTDRLKRTHQSMNAAGLLENVTKFTEEITDPDTVPEALANAFRAAVSDRRGAAALVLPDDLMAAPSAAGTLTPAPPSALGPAPASDIARAAELIQAARRPVLLVGVRGADPAACQAVRELVAATQLPVVETFQAAGVVSRELESRYVGRIGLFKNQPGDAVVANADVLVTIGYDPVEYDPRLWNTDVERTIVHIDVVPADIDNHYRPAVELRGDVDATVHALARQLDGLELSIEFEAEIARQGEALAAIDRSAGSPSRGPGGVNPAWLVLQLREHLDDDAIVAVDMGTNYIHMARHFRVYEPRHLLFSNGQQTLGVGLPWAIAAKLVRPDTQVVSVSGDGGFLYSAMELETAARLGSKLTHVIMRDNSYDMVKFQQVLTFGRESGVELGDYDITAYAAAFGAHGYRLDGPDEFAPTLRRALAEEGVSIIDVPVDYSHSGDIAAQLHEEVLI